LPHKAHLLIVDDEANTLASLSRAFRLAGHEATVCDNAARALELAKSQSFDLILSDVVMPGKGGLTLLEELKQQGVAAPVVMMSGQAHIEMAVRATRLGALDFLEKPSRKGESATSATPGQARDRGEGRGDAACDGTTGARRGQRIPRVHSRRDWHRKRAGSTHHP
jgi:DNA-binding NtrC family response regulator